MSAALGRVGWRGRDTAAEGEREREREKRGSERPNQSDVSRERNGEMSRKEETQ